MQEHEQKQAIIEYFRQGCKKHDLAGYGVEVEHIPVNPDTNEAISYWGKDGTEEILSDIEHVLHGKRIISEGHLIGLLCPDYSITLEPAAQFEISIRPCMSIARIRQIYHRFRTLVDPIFTMHGAVLRNVGYQPVSHVNDLALIPKKRYVYMDTFFQTSGHHGRNMMRGTASTQVSIDYISERDFVKKIRLAYMLGPLFALLTDNTPVFEGKPVENHLMRTQIWKSVDNARCGISPGIEDEDFGFASYADFLLQMPIILKAQGDETIQTGTLKTAEAYAGKDLTPEDVSHIVSMDFPDVRLKQYVEIRMADSLPEPLLLAYAALIKGIFGKNETIERLLKKYPICVRRIEQAQESLIADGYNGIIYGEKASCFAKKILNLASEGLCYEEKPYLAPFFACAGRGKTWAEEPYTWPPV